MRKNTAARGINGRGRVKGEGEEEEKTQNLGRPPRSNEGGGEKREAERHETKSVANWG